MNQLKQWWLKRKIARVSDKIVQLETMKHTSGYSKSEGDRRIALLWVELNTLMNKRWN